MLLNIYCRRANVGAHHWLISVNQSLTHIYSILYGLLVLLHFGTNTTINTHLTEDRNESDQIGSEWEGKVEQ